MKILFFAHLREMLGNDHVDLSDGDCPATVAALRLALRERVNGELAEALCDPNVLCAVNQKVADETQPLGPGDEIAFFPPMTGG